MCDGSDETIARNVVKCLQLAQIEINKKIFKKNSKKKKKPKILQA